MFNKEIIDNLDLLGFTPEWIELGILNVQQLHEYVEEYSVEPYDHNKEHYRVASLYEYLSSLEKISSEQISNILYLAEIDIDGPHTYEFGHSLLKSSALTDKQFEDLPSHKLISKYDYKNLIIRQSLWRQYLKEGNSEDVFDRCVKQNNGEIQRVLIENCELSKFEYQLLSEQGFSKAIRNMAIQKLNSRKIRGQI